MGRFITGGPLPELLIIFIGVRIWIRKGERNIGGWRKIMSAGRTIAPCVIYIYRMNRSERHSSDYSLFPSSSFTLWFQRRPSSLLPSEAEVGRKFCTAKEEELKKYSLYLWCDSSNAKERTSNSWEWYDEWTNRHNHGCRYPFYGWKVSPHSVWSV